MTEDGGKMKVVILAGGKGTRISEETSLKPKPMIEIGDMPIIWHIMKLYSAYGYYEFIICCGYKGYIIKEWFADYFLHMSDVTFDFTKENKTIIHSKVVEPWKVTLIDTGKESMTGYRINKIKDYIPVGEPFMMTYGDGGSDVNISDLYQYHLSHGRLATITAIQPGGRFGMLNLSNEDEIIQFVEKPLSDGNWINGGFMVLNYDIFNYLNNDENLVFEQEPLETLAYNNELKAYKHRGFWLPMDTMRDKRKLDELWLSEKAPWKVWKN